MKTIHQWKHTLFAFAALTGLFAATGAHAQPYYVDDDYRGVNALLFDPGELINGVVNFEYERALNPWFGLTGGLAINSYRSAWDPNSGDGFVAIGPEIGMRFHFIREAPRGLWLGPYLDLAYVTARDNRTVTTTFGYQLGGAIGYNFVFFRHFLLSLGAGGGFGDYGYGVRWDPRLRVGLGAVF